MIQYRAEVDGLRAVAVLPVMLFHAGLPGFAGGFVGVDIFFVISGYLITNIIYAEVAESRFSLLTFYERRARRILPALLLVCLACIPFAVAWMPPAELLDFSESLVAVNLFVSNILFWRESGYFSAAAELKPLLHTWSLGIEEQFYILFPLLLILARRLSRRTLLLGLAGLCLFSLALAEFGSRHHPAMNFYLLPSRAWELGVGAMLAILIGRGAVCSGWIRTAAPALGLLLILVAIFAFDRHTPFPGLAAVLPVGGTALIIAFAGAGDPVSRLLQWRPMVGIGLISYSAYLWHQPLFAFARLRFPGEISPALYISLIIAALVLAWLSWRFVEGPFRDRRAMPPRRLIAWLLPGVLIVMAAGAYGIWSQGLRDQFMAHASPYRRDLILMPEAYQRQLPLIYQRGRCFLDPSEPGEAQAFSAAAACDGALTGAADDLFLWGDSHAAALGLGLRSLQPNVAQYAAAGCPPRAAGDSNTDRCDAADRHVLARIAALRPATVLIHANWSLYQPRYRQEDLAAVIRAVRRASPDSRVVVLGGVPNWGSQGLPKALLYQDVGDRLAFRLDPPEMAAVRAADLEVAQQARAAGATYVSMLQDACDATGCLAFAAFDRAIEPTAWDSGHLTRAGARQAAERVRRALASPPSVRR